MSQGWLLVSLADGSSIHPQLRELHDPQLISNFRHAHYPWHPWEQLRSPLAGNVVVLTISMDLPFAQARWEQGADLGHQVPSSHRSKKFGGAAMRC